MGRTIQFIYFDLGNVLLAFDHRTACRQISRLTGVSAQRVEELVFSSGLQGRYENGDIDSREYYEQFCQASGARPDYDAFQLAGSHMFEINVPIIPIVMHLMAAGYRLGILSNTCAAHWQHISDGRYKVPKEFFELHVLSFEQRCSKPRAPIYEAAVRCAGVEDPRQVFFVDDRAENVAGALRVGMDAVVYQSPQQLAADLRGRGVRFNY